MAFAKTYSLVADGSTPYIEAAARYLVAIGGVFGGGTAKIEISADDGTTWATYGTGITAATAVEVALPPGGRLRATLTGSTSPSLSIGIGPIGIVP